MAAVGFAIEYADNVVTARCEILLAMVGEPETAMFVEHNVIGTAQHTAEIA